MNSNHFIVYVCCNSAVYKLAVTCESTKLFPYCVWSTLEPEEDPSVIACLPVCQPRTDKFDVTCERTKLVLYCRWSTLESVGNLAVIACLPVSQPVARFQARPPTERLGGHIKGRPTSKHSQAITGSSLSAKVYYTCGIELHVTSMLAILDPLVNTHAPNHRGSCLEPCVYWVSSSLSNVGIMICNWR